MVPCPPQGAVPLKINKLYASWRWLLFSLIFLLCQEIARADWRPVSFEGRRYVPMEDAANFYGLILKPAPDGRTFFLTSPKWNLRGQRDSRELTVNGVKVILCFPVRLENGKFFLSSTDVVKIVEPILRPQRIKNPEPVNTVVLDAGHGGYDTGAISLYGPEKNFTLDIVRRAAQLLEQQGYQVRLTRTTDKFIPLGQRAAVANRIPNSIFVSVHFNQGGSTPTARGVETYCLAPLGVPSMDESSVTRRDFRPSPGQQQDPQNIALAAAIHASVVRTLGFPDRGVKRARYAVIRELRVPGVLVEGGFLSDAADLRKLATPYYREQLAKGIVQGIDNYRRALDTKKPSLMANAASVTNAASAAPPVRLGPTPSLQDGRSLMKIMAPHFGSDLLGLIFPSSPLTF
jgi:N-acetylmuramoyl-L-alanine amidase